MKHKVLAFLILLPLLSTAQPQRLRKNADNDWKFHFGHASDPSKDFNYRLANIYSKASVASGTAIDPRFNDSSWRSLDLPHDWVTELPFVNHTNFDVMAHGYKPVGGYFPETSIGWYRKHFFVASSDSGHRFQLQFDGVFRDAQYWINGFYLGNHASGYLGVSFDITDFLHFGKDNVITVRVDASQYEGWFYEGAGIYRHVWLNEYDNLHVAENGMFISSVTSGRKTTLTADITVENSGLEPATCSVYTIFTTREGKKLAQTPAQTVRMGINGTTRLKQEAIITDAPLWSPDNPYLCRAVTVVKQNGKTKDSLKVRFGIRNIEIKPSGVFVNGRRWMLQGVCCHQDHAGLGSALPDYLQYYRVGLLKNMGVNAYRTSHNAPTPELLEACDSLGMLVMDENRQLSSGPEYRQQLEQLIRRDRNHPSVFIWSIGNEEWAVHGNSTGKRIAQTLLQVQKENDPTRTSTYAADNGNTFYGVNEVIPVRGFNYRHKSVAEYHGLHPLQPLMGTEMGSTVTTRGIYEKDTVRCYVPDQDITYPPWASRAEDWWTIAATHDYWLGGFVWTGFDYRGEPTPYQWPNINSHFGIMDMCGFPKNIYYYYQSWWTDKDVLHISPHWNWKGKEGKPVEVWVNSNADNVELFLNGKSQGKKEMPRNGHLTWSVNYEPGTLEAVAYKHGKKLAEKTETTGEPVEVVVTPYKTTLLADGKDAAVINISVADRNGREVPDATNLIRFRLTGEGKIIGVGNGDPSSHEPDKCADTAWQRFLFSGKCQVIVQSGTKTGMIHFEASADGLWKGGTDIQTVSPDNSTAATTANAYPAVFPSNPKPVDKMLGADISFLPELEAKGMKFSDKGVEKDVLLILKEHGFNYIRLRLFNNPSADSGYSPKLGFCDLAHTMAMAKRVKAAGMKFLLDFHYSDYWADPGKQYKPAAWKNLSFAELKKAVYGYTRDVIQQLKDQGTPPDMVQIGNEINHGILWPEGNISNPDQLAELLKAGTAAVKSVDPSIFLLLHVALGGQRDESVFFIDNMLARGVYFDVIGESYYPKWHGTTEDLEHNLADLAARYRKDLIVVEYSQRKAEVNRIAFDVPGGRGKGTCIWEPLNFWEKIFDENGKANVFLEEYDRIRDRFLK